MIIPDALVSAASKINREWGSFGYVVERVEPAGHGAVLLAVCASDGARFYVGSTRYGNTVHGEDYSAVRVELAAVITEERTA